MTKQFKTGSVKEINKKLKSSVEENQIAHDIGYRSPQDLVTWASDEIGHT